MTEAADHTETLSGAPGEPEPVRAPRILGGRYLLEERIASGGMASVWRAHDEKLARTVAVKLLHQHLSADDDFRERFRREAVSAAKLSHPNIVGVYDTGTDEDRVYLVMEFIDGITLKDVISEVGALEPGQAAAIGEKVARALDYAHSRGLVHRDVKPANILLGDDGVVKVADFGIAKAEEAGNDLTKTGMVLGTAAYVAPEQILAQPLDGRADQYGLGCVLYEGLTGQQPFKGESTVAMAAQRLDSDPLPARSVRADVPRGLDDVVLRALARRPEDRFPSSGLFADALAPWADPDTDATVALVTPDFDRFDNLDGFGGDSRLAGGGATRGRDSFVRSEGRWLGPVIALLVLAGTLVGVGLATGVLESDTIPSLLARDGQAPEEEQARQPAEPAETIAVAGFDSLDPPGQGGDGSENNDLLAGIGDGDPSTQWRTDLYASADFGNLKEGLGVIVDLGTPHVVSELTLETSTPGFGFQVRVADQPSETLDGWRSVATVDSAQATTDVALDDIETQYLLIWITGPLQPSDGRFMAAISDVTVRGSSQ